MKLFVNGDSHTAAAEAVNPHAFAEDDGRYNYLGRVPHPANLRVSWGKRLSETLKYGFYCAAESASSNHRIRRTTREWIQQNPQSTTESLVIIQWSTWERQEWLIDGMYYQVTASGIDDVPSEHQDRYRRYIADLDWQAVTEYEHHEIWQLHQELADLSVPHVFFNGNNHFDCIPEDQRRDWGASYIAPYDPESTYHQWLLAHGFQTVSPDSYHFGTEAHGAWSVFMLQYVIKNQMV